MKKHFTREEARKVAEKLGVTWMDFDTEQFRMGMDVELEHGKINSKTNVTNDDPVKTGKITLAHLNEFPDYYTRLKSMEIAGDKKWKNKKRLNVVGEIK